MEVHLIAHTTFATNPWDVSPYQKSPDEPNHADELAEFAGRLCYESWDRPNPATASNSGYLRNIIDHRHFSVLEHGSATFYINGVSRTLTHEFVRHRHLSYSQVSQRYVDESKREIVIPPALAELAEKDEEAQEKIQKLLDLDVKAKALYSELHEFLHQARGFAKKEARQSARAALLGSQSTALVVTGNHGAWREVISKRFSPHADVEIRQLAQELLRQLKGIAPNVYQDMEIE